MDFFTKPEIRAIAKRALECGLSDQRATLLATLPLEYIGSLRFSDVPASQTLFDLTALNRTESIREGVVPLYEWLQNAAYLLANQEEHARFFDDQSAKVLANLKKPASRRLKTVGHVPFDVKTLPEKIIHTDDLLPHNFLLKAVVTCSSVARLIVTRFQGGDAVKMPHSSKTVRYFGTGWLIGAQHLITNFHVINARRAGEGLASEADFATQAKNTLVQFDYDDFESEPTEYSGAKVVAANRDLDYSVLEINEEMKRKPVGLITKEVDLDAGILPLNIIQHPRGSPKALGIRNNLAAIKNHADLAYFTDTDGGSSGSPVCTDDWNVVALHKAASWSFGDFEFQGKNTAFVNVGTRIDRIVQDLQLNKSDVWDSIDARICD